LTAAGNAPVRKLAPTSSGRSRRQAAEAGRARMKTIGMKFLIAIEPAARRG
jgi:hypothetical protein